MSLNVSLLVDAVVSSLCSIPELVTAMNGDQSRIFAYHYMYGIDNPLDNAIYQLKPPSIMVAWETTESGNFDAFTIFKHEILLYIRVASQAQAVNPISYETLWWLICNGHVNNGPTSIRYTQVLLDANGAPLVDIPDSPSVGRMSGRDGEDYFVGHFWFPEITTGQNP